MRIPAYHLIIGNLLDKGNSIIKIMMICFVSLYLVTPFLHNNYTSTSRDEVAELSHLRQLNPIILLSHINPSGSLAEIDNKLSDTIEKEFLITRATTKEQLQAIQLSVSENNYQLHIDSCRFSKDALVKIVGFIKHKDAAKNNNSFYVTNFKTFKIIINKDNKKGKIELEWTDLKTVKI